MNFLLSAWRILNLLSIDVVMGAMAGMLFFADVLDMSLPMGLYMVLGMAVWSVYTLDHLLDARKTGYPASSDRHRFHQENFKSLSIVLLLMIGLGLFCVLYFQSLKFILFPGLILGIVMGIWMGLLHLFGKKASWLKEFSTAVFYVSGIAFGPFIFVYPNEIPTPFYYFLLGYLVLASLNLLMLSYLDEQTDRLDGFGSILQVLSRPGLKNLIWVLALTGVVGMLTALLILPSYYSIHASILMLLFLFHIREFYAANRDRIREKLEASFLLPFILLLF